MRVRLAFVAVALAAACASRPVSAPPPDTAAVEPPDPPRAVQPAPDLPLEGFWRWNIHPGFSRMTLEVRPHGEGEFVLVGYYGTDTGQAQEETLARRVDGSLVMEGTLRGLNNRGGRLARSLHPVRVKGEERLMPDGNLGELERGETPGGNEFAFRRLSPEQAAAFPAEWEREVEGWRQRREESRRRHESAPPAQPKEDAAHPAGAASR